MQGDELAGECDDSIAFFEQLRSDHRLHRHPKLHRTTLCVTGPRNHGQRAVPIASALFPLRAGFS